MASESVQPPPIGSAYGETQIGAESFQTVSVLAASVVVVAVVAGCMMGYFKKRKGNQEK